MGGGHLSVVTLILTLLGGGEGLHLGVGELQRLGAVRAEEGIGVGGAHDVEEVDALHEAMEGVLLFLPPGEG